MSSIEIPMNASLASCVGYMRSTLTDFSSAVAYSVGDWLSIWMSVCLDVVKLF